MDLRKKERIKTEIKKADDFLEAAELLHRKGFHIPSITASYHAAAHALTAAFLTSGSRFQKEAVEAFGAVLVKFTEKVDFFIHKMREAKTEWGPLASIDYIESDAMKCFCQVKEFVAEVKDFLKRTSR